MRGQLLSRLWSTIPPHAKPVSSSQLELPIGGSCVSLVIEARRFWATVSRVGNAFFVLAESLPR